MAGVILALVTGVLMAVDRAVPVFAVGAVVLVGGLGLISLGRRIGDRD